MIAQSLNLKKLSTLNLFKGATNVIAAISYFQYAGVILIKVRISANTCANVELLS